MRHVELFSGIGGFRQAMRLLTRDGGPEFDCVGYSEIDAAADSTYRANFDVANETVIGDIAAFVEDAERMDGLRQFNLLTGGFPCQSFSMMGAQRGFEDTRGTLFFSMARLIDRRRPTYLLLENVKNLKTHDGGNTYRVIEQTLRDMGYEVWSDIFNTSNYGLAQTRNRIYIFATNRRIPRKFQFTEMRVREHFNGLRNTSLQHQNSTTDVLRLEVPEKYYLSDRLKRTILANGSGGFVAKSEIDLVIARPLCATMAKMHRACQDNYFSSRYITSYGRRRYAGGVVGAEGVRIRRLLPEEAFALQGFDPAFVANSRAQFGTADCSLYKQAGNAVSVNVVYGILSYLADAFNWR